MLQVTIPSVHAGDSRSLWRGVAGSIGHPQKGRESWTQPCATRIASSTPVHRHSLLKTPDPLYAATLEISPRAARFASC
jgi:hypothetical protein